MSDGQKKVCDKVRFHIDVHVESGFELGGLWSINSHCHTEPAGSSHSLPLCHPGKDKIS